MTVLASEVSTVSRATLIPYARNARTHSAEQINQIAKSILGGKIKKKSHFSPLLKEILRNERRNAYRARSVIV